MPVCIRGAVQFNERTSATTVRGGTPVFDRQCSVIGAKKRRRYRGMTAASSLQRLRRAVRLLGSNAIAVLLPALLHDSAVLFMTLCLFVCLSVCHKSVFYRNIWTDRADFWHGGFLRPIVHCVLRKFRYLKH